VFEKERQKCLSFFLQKIWLSGLFVVNLFNQKHKTMLNLTEDELFNSFLDDDYQAKQFQIQNKTPYRERKPKQENIIDMVALANKIFLK
jgi:prolyl oligopeptidase PreP (S9A serine peptidase family)